MPKFKKKVKKIRKTTKEATSSPMEKNVVTFDAPKKGTGVVCSDVTIKG